VAFKDFPAQQQSVQLLQRSLERGRLAHGYLFSGQNLDQLEGIARTLAKTLACEQPARQNGAAVDCCDACLACRRIDHGNHPDVHWVRPESKSRVITVDQMRGLMQEIYLKPNEAAHKVCVVVAADRLNDKASNAFLKTLEEPPPGSILTLLTVEPQRILETITSRCLRLNFSRGESLRFDAAELEWLTPFSEMAATDQKSLLSRYRLMDVLLRRLTAAKERITETLTARSPIQQYKDADKDLVDQWEEELTAAIEAEYRRQRADLLAVLHWWLRDLWLGTLGQQPGRASSSPGQPGTGAVVAADLFSFPQLKGTAAVAARISSREAMENLQVLEQLQRWLGSNVQEALALEVGLLKLRL